MLRSIAWHGMRAVEFSKGDYAALLVPDMGANLVRLADTRRGIEILRAPAGDEVEEFRRRPHVFGLPILFPPNRIADGQYTFDGRTYRFPITDAKGGHYHHGILKSQPFAVSKAWETADEVLVECRYYSNAGNDAIFRDFPHEFKCKIVYRLTARGLEQEVMFANRSKEPMPVGVGFHTPMRIPFAGGAAGDYVMRAAVGERVELSERNIPTGRKLPLSEKFARLRGAGLQVTDCDPIEAAFTVREIEVRQAVPRRVGREPAHGCTHLLRGRRTDDLLDDLEQRRQGALLLPRAAVVDDQRPEHARPRSRRFPVDRHGRHVEHEIPVVRQIVVVPESGTVSDENGRRRSV